MTFISCSKDFVPLEPSNHLFPCQYTLIIKIWLYFWLVTRIKAKTLYVYLKIYCCLLLLVIILIITQVILKLNTLNCNKMGWESQIHFSKLMLVVVYRLSQDLDKIYRKKYADMFWALCKTTSKINYICL